MLVAINREQRCVERPRANDQPGMRQAGYSPPDRREEDRLAVDRKSVV